MIKIYLRGPMDEFNLPLNKEATEFLTFRGKTPGVSAEEISQEVTNEVAEELLTRRGVNFRPVNPEEAESLFSSRPKGGRGRKAGRNTPQTNLPANAPATEKGATQASGTPVNPLVPINPNDPLVEGAINDPRRTK